MAKKHGTYYLYIHKMYIYIHKMYIYNTYIYIYMGIHTDPRVFRNILPNPNCYNFRKKKHQRRFLNDGGLLAQHVLVEATCKPCLAAKGNPGDDQKPPFWEGWKILEDGWHLPHVTPVFLHMRPPRPLRLCLNKTLYFMKQYYERPGCHNTGISGILQSKWTWLNE